MTLLAEDDEIRVLYVIGGRRLGGMEHHLIALASQLPPSVRCQVCCLEASADYLARLTDARIEHTNLDWPNPAASTWSACVPAVRTRRQTLSSRTSCTRTALSADIVAGLLRARGANVRIITSRRGEDANRRHHAIRRLVNRLSDKVVCVSQETAAFVQSTESPRPGLLTVIPNGVAVCDRHGDRPRDREQTGRSGSERWARSSRSRARTCSSTPSCSSIERRPSSS